MACRYVTGLPEALQASALARLQRELRALGVSRADAKAILARAASHRMQPQRACMPRQRAGRPASEAPRDCSPHAAAEVPAASSELCQGAVSSASQQLVGAGAVSSASQQLVGAGTAASRTLVIRRRAAALRSHLQRKQEEVLVAAPGGALADDPELVPTRIDDDTLPPLAAERSPRRPTDRSPRRGVQSIAFPHAPSATSFRPRQCAAYSFSFGPVPPRPPAPVRQT